MEISLKEEIIQAIINSKGGPIPLEPLLADYILKLFEKRIDSRIAYYKSGGLVELSDNLEIIEELQEVKKILK